MNSQNENQSASLSRSAVADMAKSLVRTVALRQILLLKQVWVWPIIACVLLGTIGLFLRNAIETEMRAELASKLQTILDADVTALSIWLESQQEIAASIANDDDVRSSIEKLVQIAADPNVKQLDLLNAPELEVLRARLRPVLESHGQSGFAVVDRNHKVIAGMRNDTIGLAIPDEELELRISQILEGASSVTPPMKSLVLLPDKDGQLQAGRPTMFAMAPVRSADGTIVAALGLRVRPEDDFTRILQVAQAGETGETYAFDRRGLMLSQSRFDAELRSIGLLTEDTPSILNLHVRDPAIDMTSGERPAVARSDQPLTQMVTRAVDGEPGVDIDGYRDYRGVPVIGAWTWLHDYDFGVATEVDVAEAYRPLRFLRIAFWGMFALLLASSAAIFIF